MDEFIKLLPLQAVGLFRILFAGVLGLVLGIERTKRQKEAGIRTHFTVGIASALMMTVSLYFENDSARIAAQIVTGIGFLGAGMIFFRRENLHGLTTAAGIWATAGIGMACGAGLYLLALGTTLIILVGFIFFHSRVIRVRETRHMLLVKFDYTVEAKTLLQQEFKVEQFSRFKAFEKDGRITAEAVIHTKENCDAEQLVAIVNTTDEIHSIERLEDL